MDKLKERGSLYNLSVISQLFWASEEEEMESAPHDMKLKWKKVLQKRNGSVDFLNAESSVREDCESRWPDLPMELLVQIMALVDNRTVVVASGVCTGWREAIRDGIVDLSFSWCGRNVSKLVQSVAPKFTRLRSCNLCRSPLLDDFAVETLGKYMHDLRVLDLTYGLNLTNKSLHALANGCVLLEKLNLSGCSRITEVGLVTLVTSCSKLRHLNLCGCENACSDKTLMSLAQSCNDLRYLNVGWCAKITDMGVAALAYGCSDLRVVDLCGCHLITDRSVIALASRCHQLRALGLHICRNITNVSMYSLANNSTLWQSDIGKGNYKWSSKNALSGQWRSNEITMTRSSSGSCSRSSSSSSCNSSTNIHSPTKGYFETLVNDPVGCGLVSLNLSGCTLLSASAVQAVCDAYPALHTCPERCSLNVSGCLNLTSVHCVCVIEARRERVSRASGFR